MEERQTGGNFLSLADSTSGSNTDEFLPLPFVTLLQQFSQQTCIKINLNNMIFVQGFHKNCANQMVRITGSYFKHRSYF